MSVYPSLIPNSFQCPNVYVDRLHYYLTPQEIVVLDKAVREILGWSDKIAARKARIAVSIFVDGKRARDGTILAYGCGLCRSAVLKALEALDRYNILCKVGDPTREGQEYFLQDDSDLIDWQGLMFRRQEWDGKNRERTSAARGLSDRPEEERSVIQTDEPSVGQTGERSVAQTERNPVETHEKPMKRVPTGTGAQSAPGTTGHPAGTIAEEETWQGYALVVTHFPEDLTFDCPSCQARSLPWPKHRSDFVCSACKVPLAGFELGNDTRGTPDWRPPRKEVEERDTRILGNLLPFCPPRLAGIPYKARDRIDLQQLWRGPKKNVLLCELEFQCNLWLTKQARRIDVAHNALVSALHKIEARGDDGQEKGEYPEEFVGTALLFGQTPSDN